MDPISLQIGERLRRTRHEHGWSLSQLSERTGCLSKSRISNYEQGLRRMSIEVAERLAEAFGNVTPGYLLCLEEHSPFMADELRLIERYRAADKRGKATIDQVAELQEVPMHCRGSGGQNGLAVG